MFLFWKWENWSLEYVKTPIFISSFMSCHIQVFILYFSHATFIILVSAVLCVCMLLPRGVCTCYFYVLNKSLSFSTPPSLYHFVSIAYPTVIDIIALVIYPSVCLLHQTVHLKRRTISPLNNPQCIPFALPNSWFILNVQQVLVEWKHKWRCANTFIFNVLISFGYFCNLQGCKILIWYVRA